MAGATRNEAESGPVDADECVLDADGRVVGASGSRVLPLYSITKTFIAALVVGLDVDLDATLEGWFDAALLPEGRRITVAHLLTHTSGLRDYGNLPAYQQAVEGGEPAWSDREFAARTLAAPLLSAPGARFSYSNPGYWVLRRLAERVSDRSFDELVQTRVCARYGLPDTRVVHGLFSPRLPGYPAEWVWHGLIESTAEQTARFMASREVAALRERVVAVRISQPPWRNPSYGLGLMIDRGRCYGHNGGGPAFRTSCLTSWSGRTAAVLAVTDGPEEPVVRRALALAGLAP